MTLTERGTNGLDLHGRGKDVTLGHPVLRGKMDSVTNPSAPAVQTLIDDMMATVANVNGVGLAAPQVYEPLTLFILASKPSPRYPNAPLMEPAAIINPEILWMSEEKEKGWEGCLSIPGFRGLIPRHQRVGVRYQTSSNKVVEIEYSDFLARIFQHEFDHIQGIVFIDRMESTLELAGTACRG